MTTWKHGILFPAMLEIWRHLFRVLPNIDFQCFLKTHGIQRDHVNLFRFFFPPYTALPKRSGLFVKEAWVGVAFFFSHVVALLGEVGGEYLEGARQKCRVDSAALFAFLPLCIRVDRIRREPLTLRSPVPLAIFLTPNLIAASYCVRSSRT